MIYGSCMGAINEFERSVIRLLISIFALVCLQVSAQAAEEKYTCTIERGFSLGPSGLSRDRRVLSALETRTFEIDRRSGAVTGSVLENLQYSAEVVAPGDADNSFQVYWIVRGRAGSRVRFIEVQEFEDGPQKPFRAIVQNWTYTGVCE